MAFDVEALFRLWTDPLPEGPAAEDAFRTLYTDPVVVNGVPLTAADLVSRARAMQGSSSRSSARSSTWWKATAR